MGLAQGRTTGEHPRVGVRFGPVCTGLQSKSLCLGVTRENTSVVCRGEEENKEVVSVLNSREGKNSTLTFK